MAPSRKTKVSVFLTPAQARRLKVMAVTEGLTGVSELVARWIDQAEGEPAERRAAA